MPLRQRALYGFVFAVFAAIALAYGGMYYAERVNQARESQALSCAKMLGLAAIQYAQDHNNRYPDAGRWEQELEPYLTPNDKYFGDVVHPQTPFQGTARRFSYNPALSGKSLASVDNPSGVWMFYESVSEKPSASDDLDAWPDPERDKGNMFAVVYGDGHCYSRPFEWKQGVRQHLPGM